MVKVAILCTCGLVVVGNDPDHYSMAKQAADASAKMRAHIREPWLEPDSVPVQMRSDID